MAIKTIKTYMINKIPKGQCMDDSKHQLLTSINEQQKNILTIIEDDYKKAVMDEIELLDEKATIEEYAKKVGIFYLSEFPKKYCKIQEICLFIYMDNFQIEINNKKINIDDLSEVAITTIMREIELQ